MGYRLVDRPRASRAAAKNNIRKPQKRGKLGNTEISLELRIKRVMGRRFSQIHADKLRLRIL